MEKSQMIYLQALKNTLATEEKPTLGKTLGPAMSIKDQEEADLYLEELVAWSARRNSTKELVRRTLRGSLGCFAGYCDDETRARVERLFSCEHPVFGRTVPSASAAFEAGSAAARDDNTQEDDGR